MITKVTFDDVQKTSFHEQTIRFTLNELKNAFGEFVYEFPPKINCEWCLKINDLPFTIYDWKEYGKSPTSFPNEYFYWHIGSQKPLELDILIKIVEYIVERNS